MLNSSPTRCGTTIDGPGTCTKQMPIGLWSQGWGVFLSVYSPRFFGTSTAGKAPRSTGWTTKTTHVQREMVMCIVVCIVMCVVHVGCSVQHASCNVPRATYSPFTPLLTLHFLNKSCVAVFSLGATVIPASR